LGLIEAATPIWVAALVGAAGIANKIANSNAGIHRSCLTMATPKDPRGS